MTQTRSDLATIAAVAQLLAVVLAVAALFFARDVFVPLALGVLLSFLLSPVVNRLQRWGIPNVMAVVATAALAFLLLAGLFTLLGRELTTLVSELPKHREELITKARSFAGLTTGVGGSLDQLADDVAEAMEGETEPQPEVESEGKTAFERWTDKLLPMSTQSSLAIVHDGKSAKSPLYVQEIHDDLPLASWATTAGTVLGPLATASLVSVFALFMLIHREDLRDRIIAVVSHGNYVTTTEALDEAAQRISRYLIAQTIINASYGFVLSAGLAVIGATMTDQGMFPNVMLWGLLATCLRFVPYIGPVVSAIFPLVIALSVFPGYGVALAVLALIVTMELLSNNILEPWLYGASTGLSAVAVIIAVVFWGWLWGPVGILLSTPLTVCLVVIGRYVPRFKILSTLLGEEVELKTSMRFYQRMLATDEHRAWEILREHFDGSDINTTGDQVIVPVLKRIRQDHYAEHLSDADVNRLFAMAGGFIAKLRQHGSIEIDEQEEVIQEDGTASSSGEANPKVDLELPLVVGCASHHFSESLILNLLRVSGHSLFKLQAIDTDLLADDASQQILNLSPAMVVIVVLPKGGFAQARFLCRSIRGEGFTGPIVIACLGNFTYYDQLFVKFRKAGASSVTTSFSQTHAKIESILKRRENVTNIARQQLNPVVV
jgi:predicted PurR-regulated permease PerM